MPLPPPVDRELMHVRTIDLRGYRRSDGLFDIEGHVTDVKTHPLQPPGRDSPVPAGSPVHNMSVRLVFDEHLVISEAVGTIDTGPYGDCSAGSGPLSTLRGARIGPGWSKRVKALLGAQSCTHLVELLIPMATAAYQTIAPLRFKRVDPVDAEGRPSKIDSCYAYGSARTLVMKRWPAHYTGGGDT